MLAQGFSPGLAMRTNTLCKSGRPGRCGRSGTPTFGCPFRACSDSNRFPGLKPWADVFKAPLGRRISSAVVRSVTSTPSEPKTGTGQPKTENPRADRLARLRPALIQKAIRNDMMGFLRFAQKIAQLL
jgi:hypothetical protein